MLTKTERINIKKLILAGISPGNRSTVLSSIILELLNLQTLLRSDKPLFTASEYILAYLDLGLGYLEHRDLFDHVLTEAGFSKEEIGRFHQINPAIKLNKAKLQTLLGKWPASSHNSHTKAQAVDEIIRLVSLMQNGEYSFYTAKKDGTLTTLFVLSIADNTAIIHHVTQNKYYRLVKD